MMLRRTVFTLYLALFLYPNICGAEISGPADLGRIEKDIKAETKKNPSPSIRPTLPARPETRTAPKDSHKIKFVLKSVQIDGITRLNKDTVLATYAPMLGTKISLNQLWDIANRITEIYQKQGYFLSRVYVPEQEIDGGVVRLRAVEGFIHKINLDEAAQKNPFVSEWVNPLIDLKPLTLHDLESTLLRLNQIPGHEFRAVLGLPHDPKAPEGSTELNIVTLPAPATSRVSIDNYGSKFIGPYRIVAQTNMSLIPNQKTSLMVASTLPLNELKYGAFQHEIPITQNWTIDFGAGLAGSAPGYTLAQQDMHSTSKTVNIGATYFITTQRDYNAALHVGIDVGAIKSKILGSEIVADDQSRILRISYTTSWQDTNMATNISDIKLSKGLSVLGGSEKGDDNLSRGAANPDFYKVEFLYSRSQPLPRDLTLIGAAAGQYSNSSLFSNEEFGYGGQNFGRAYDFSEITGDSGVNGTLELQYRGLPEQGPLSYTPYVYYDIGKIWNNDPDQHKPSTASSAGAGIRGNLYESINFNLCVAIPLTKNAQNPIYGNGSSPRFGIQISHSF